MKCPIDQTELMMAERQGIEIDYCTKYRAVWLDRGELDKLIERSAWTEGKVRTESSSRKESRYRTSGYKQPCHKKCKSLLGDCSTSDPSLTMAGPRGPGFSSQLSNSFPT